MKYGFQDAVERQKERLRQRDRRSTFTCALCRISFKNKKGTRGANVWCPDCRFVSLDCDFCGEIYILDRKTVKARSSKYCSLACSQAKTCFKEGLSPEEYPSYKHGKCTKDNKKSFQVFHRKNNPDLYKTYSETRRARKLNANGSFTNEEWVSLKEKYENMCLCCGLSEPQITLSIDHIVPLSKGGSNSIENIQPLCRSCNSKKHTRIINYKK